MFSVPPPPPWTECYRPMSKDEVERERVSGHVDDKVVITPKEQRYIGLYLNLRYDTKSS